MKFDYPHVNSPEADAIVTHATALVHEDNITRDDEETILEAALIIEARHNLRRLASDEDRDD